MDDLLVRVSGSFGRLYRAAHDAKLHIIRHKLPIMVGRQAQLWSICR